jgi:hypothetical protein
MDTGSLPEVLSNRGVTDYGLVMAYDSTATENERWMMFDPDAASYANDLSEMNPGWGYWINVVTENTWTVPYTLP